jgi:hypothetical protein
MSSTTADPEPAEVSTSCPEPATFAVQEPAVTASAESLTAAEDLADSCDKKLSARIQPHVVVTAAAVETVVRKQRCHVDSCGEELASRAQLRAHLRQVTEKHFRPAHQCWIRIRIHMFLGLSDPDPLVSMDPDPDPALDPDPSIIMQK